MDGRGVRDDDRQTGTDRASAAPRGRTAAYTAHIPGLLQTTEHAREVFAHGVTKLSPPEIEHRVSFRAKRQAVLYRDEAALRMKFGGPKVARRQLEYLLEMGSWTSPMAR